MEKETNHMMPGYAPEGVVPAAPVGAAPEICANCGAVMAEGQGFCSKCGAPRSASVPHPVCSNCGAELNPGQAACAQCGAVVGGPNPGVRRAAPAAKKNAGVLILVGSLALALVIAVVLFLVLRGTPVKSVEFEDGSVTLKVGDTLKLDCEISPNDATNKELTWESSDEDVAEVSEKGKVTAIEEGTCEITVTSHNGKTDTCKITVEKAGPDFQELYDEYCSPIWADVGSDGSYLSIDTNPYNEDDSGLAYYDAYTALKELHTAMNLPDSLIEDMGSTSSSMGKQSETFTNEGVTVTWTYHPDKGLEVTYKLIHD